MPLYEYVCPVCFDVVERLQNKPDGPICLPCEVKMERTVELSAKTPDKWKV